MPSSGMFLLSVLQLLVTANVPSSPILVTLMIEAICFSETSILTRFICHIPEDGIPYSHRRENLKIYKCLLCGLYYISYLHILLSLYSSLAD
jgi:hypothetical protein